MIDSFIVWLKNNWTYLKVAIYFDEEDIKNSKVSNAPLPNKLSNFKNWFRIFGFGTLILLTSIVIVWKLIQPEYKPAKYRSHHGVNKFGKRY